MALTLPCDVDAVAGYFRTLRRNFFQCCQECIPVVSQRRCVRRMRGCRCQRPPAPRKRHWLEQTSNGDLSTCCSSSHGRILLPEPRYIKYVCHLCNRQSRRLCVLVCHCKLREHVQMGRYLFSEIIAITEYLWAQRTSAHLAHSYCNTYVVVCSPPLF